MRTFVIADLHFGHEKIVKFEKEGKPLRPWDDVDEMNKVLVSNWNAVVGDKDLVYVLGDFTVNGKHVWLAQELRGRKVLVKGNHDTAKLAEYAEYFEDVIACRVLDWAILTHIPIHPMELGRFKHNIHGHLHDKRVPLMCDSQHPALLQIVADPAYTCVSVEQTGYKPMDIQEIYERVRAG